MEIPPPTPATRPGKPGLDFFKIAGQNECYRAIRWVVPSAEYPAFYEEKIKREAHIEPCSCQWPDLCWCRAGFPRRQRPP